MPYLLGIRDLPFVLPAATSLKSLPHVGGQLGNYQQICALWYEVLIEPQVRERELKLIDGVPYLKHDATIESAIHF